MKNVNLTGIYLGLMSSFGVKAMEVSSIVPDGGEPIDVLITFKGGNFGWFDLEDAADKCQAVENIAKANITGEFLSLNTKIKENSDLELYIEFKHSSFVETEL